MKIDRIILKENDKLIIFYDENASAMEIDKLTQLFKQDFIMFTPENAFDLVVVEYPEGYEHPAQPEMGTAQYALNKMDKDLKEDLHELNLFLQKYKLIEPGDSTLLIAKTVIENLLKAVVENDCMPKNITKINSKE